MNTKCYYNQKESTAILSTTDKMVNVTIKLKRNGDIIIDIYNDKITPGSSLYYHKELPGNYKTKDYL